MDATTVTASHKKDTERFRVFQVDEDQGIVGSIYVPLDDAGDEPQIALRVAPKRAGNGKGRKASADSE